MCALYKSGFSNILEEAFKFLWVKNEFMVKHIDYIFKMFGWMTTRKITQNEGWDVIKKCSFLYYEWDLKML